MVRCGRRRLGRHGLVKMRSDDLDDRRVVRDDLRLGVVDVALARTFDGLEHLDELRDGSQTRGSVLVDRASECR